MDGRKQKLIAYGAELYRLGLELDEAKEALRGLVEQGVPYDSAQMRAAYTRAADLSDRWKALEAQYLALRREL